MKPGIKTVRKQPSSNSSRSKSTDWREVIKKNYYQVLFVLAAFLVMVLAGCFFVSGILRNRLLVNAEDNLFSAEANIRAAFAESEISLNSSFQVISDMLNEGASQEEILDYLKSTSAWMRQNQRGLMGFHGIYGYIRGEILDSLEFNFDKNFIPQTRPWYQAAIRSGKAPVAYTAPYFDQRSGNTIITAVKNIVDEEGNYHGILAIDMSMDWINEYIKTLRLGSGGYGMVVSQNMVIMTHPDQSALGKQLQELGAPFGDISRRLRVGEEISALQYKTGGGRVITFFRRTFNGWYVGLVTPTMAYYEDLYYAALLLSVLGFALMCALSYLLLRINAAKMKADENSLSKSTFLAKMSHEIRTPMNAIIGMTELILRENLSPGARNYAGSIRQAGNNLLSIINDILDFSKIESGKMDIVCAEYQFASVINDVIAITTMRINEKPISFIARIDGSLPAVLVGDEVRVRQVLLNLLSNAVKYTREGSVTFSVRRDDNFEDQAKADRDGEEARITLAFEVADTGIGIKKEDMEKLFGNFVQFDKSQNRNIEGTGLGLAISRSLCLLMGGDITVKSEYGRGSVFTAFMPQLIKNNTPLARVENPETKAVLVYEDRSLYAESIAYTISALGVACTVARGRDDFLEQVAGGAGRAVRQFVFAASALFDEARELLQNRGGAGGAEGPAGMEPVLVLLSEYGQAARPDTPTVFIPLQPAATANVLNGREDDTGYYEIENPGVRFTAPGARVLIVDDIETNLSVAEGLLKPYLMSIDCAGGGLEAIQLVQQNYYDLIFMDHMMPGMDGIEAATAIRVWEESQDKKNVPIIALTANAVSGMKEMFLEKGFNDYISKPIKIAKLDEIVSRWIPAEKQIKAGTGIKREVVSGAAGIFIPGVDVKQGIAMTGGTEAGYRRVLSMFRKDAAARLSLFSAPPAGTELAAFAIQAHAIKGAAGTIGAAELSKEAAVLEAAGKAGDTETIGKTLPGFHGRLAEFIEALGKALAESGGTASGDESLPALNSQPVSNSPPGIPRPSLLSLKEALAARNMKETDRILGEMEQLPLGAEARELINSVSDKVLMGKYEGAIETITLLLAAGEQ
jgi:signal transduction histidine kinase/CheY-like chemotaxis protein